jgi:hypothetical protein
MEMGVTGNQGLEIRDWRLEIGGWKLEVGSLDFGFLDL